MQKSPEVQAGCGKMSGASTALPAWDRGDETKRKRESPNHVLSANTMGDPIGEPLPKKSNASNLFQQLLEEDGEIFPRVSARLASAMQQPPAAPTYALGSIYALQEANRMDAQTNERRDLLAKRVAAMSFADLTIPFGPYIGAFISDVSANGGNLQDIITQNVPASMPISETFPQSGGPTPRAAGELFMPDADSPGFANGEERDKASFEPLVSGVAQYGEEDAEMQATEDPQSNANVEDVSARRIGAPLGVKVEDLQVTAQRNVFVTLTSLVEGYQLISFQSQEILNMLRPAFVSTVRQVERRIWTEIPASRGRDNLFIFEHEPTHQVRYAEFRRQDDKEARMFMHIMKNVMAEPGIVREIRDVITKYMPEEMKQSFMYYPEGDIARELVDFGIHTMQLRFDTRIRRALDADVDLERLKTIMLDYCVAKHKRFHAIWATRQMMNPRDIYDLFLREYNPHNDNVLRVREQIACFTTALVMLVRNSFDPMAATYTMLTRSSEKDQIFNRHIRAAFALVQSMYMTFVNSRTLSPTSMAFTRLVPRQASTRNNGAQAYLEFDFDMTLPPQRRRLNVENYTMIMALDENYNVEDSFFTKEVNRQQFMNINLDMNTDRRMRALNIIDEEMVDNEEIIRTIMNTNPMTLGDRDTMRRMSTLRYFMFARATSQKCVNYMTEMIRRSDQYITTLNTNADDTDDPQVLLDVSHQAQFHLLHFQDVRQRLQQSGLPTNPIPGVVDDNNANQWRALLGGTVNGFYDVLFDFEDNQDILTGPYDRVIEKLESLRTIPQLEMNQYSVMAGLANILGTTARSDLESENMTMQSQRVDSSRTNGTLGSAIGTGLTNAALSFVSGTILGGPAVGTASLVSTTLAPIFSYLASSVNMNRTTETATNAWQNQVSNKFTRDFNKIAEDLRYLRKTPEQFNARLQTRIADLRIAKAELISKLDVLRRDRDKFNKTFALHHVDRKDEIVRILDDKIDNLTRTISQLKKRAIKGLMNAVLNEKYDDTFIENLEIVPDTDIALTPYSYKKDINLIQRICNESIERFENNEDDSWKVSMLEMATQYAQNIARDMGAGYDTYKSWKTTLRFMMPLDIVSRYAVENIKNQISIFDTNMTISRVFQINRQPIRINAEEAQRFAEDFVGDAYNTEQLSNEYALSRETFQEELNIAKLMTAYMLNHTSAELLVSAFNEHTVSKETIYAPLFAEELTAKVLVDPTKRNVFARLVANALAGQELKDVGNNRVQQRVLQIKRLQLDNVRLMHNMRECI